MISYEPFWNTLHQRGISVYELLKYYRISGNTIQKLRDNENLTIKTIERLCKILNCNIENIVEVTK
ncbi:MAG: helix-turn-helix domain-containing protein [Methanobrevibacter sp.]|nr:helix-turn-helix domain-containing protein [Methanobrevibacter sp.]